MLALLLGASADQVPDRTTARPSTRLLAASAGWSTYHRDNTRTGFDPAAAAFPAGGAPSARWSSGTLDGAVYAEPLALADRIYVATENNSVYALDESTGSRVWYHHFAASVPDPATAVGCGNINPVGITGTPVIDVVNQFIYAVGLVSVGGTTTDKYQLFASHLSDGSPVAGFPIDITPSGLDPVYQIQRAALGLAPNGSIIYVNFGGWSGDCNPYHPFVVGVPVNALLGGSLITYQPQSASQGRAGLWGPSGMAIDGSGNVYVSTGNGSYGSGLPCDNTKWDHGNAVIKLNQNLSELDYFAPTNWCQLSASDQDLGSLGPILVQNGELFASGKPGDGWVLNSAGLGHFGGQLNQGSSQHIGPCASGDAVFGGMAYVAPIVYVPCLGVGVVALSLNTGTGTYSVAWQSPVTFSPGPPIVAGGVVWAMQAGGGALYGFDAATGAQRFKVSIGGATRFATPTEDNGWIIVPENQSVEGFTFSSSSLGGILTSGPGASAWSANRLDAFVRGTDNGLWHDGWNGTFWQGWQPFGGILTSDPSAASWAANRIDVFVRGTDNGLWHIWWDGIRWSGWEPLGGVLTSGPDVASPGSNQLDVVVRGTDNALWHKAFGSGGWQNWERIPGVLTSDPAAVSWGAGRFDVAVRGADGGLWHTWKDAGGWHTWEWLGGVLTSSPALSSCASGRLDAFALGTDGGLWRISFNGTWGTWQPFGGQWSSSPAAVCRPSTTNTDVFVEGADAALWRIPF